uniref:Secreted protein n=1 Tax=Steinernema glaseri TaxID=37863 RepID=A0A1I8ABE1_9BILA
MPHITKKLNYLLKGTHSIMTMVSSSFVALDRYTTRPGILRLDVRFKRFRRHLTQMNSIAQINDPDIAAMKTVKLTRTPAIN